MTQDVDLKMIENRTSAARTLMHAKMEEYVSILSVGDSRSRERARQGVMFAVEALLDLQAEHMYAILVRQGIDPEFRHMRPRRD